MPHNARGEIINESELPNESNPRQETQNVTNRNRSTGSNFLIGLVVIIFILIFLCWSSQNIGTRVTRGPNSVDSESTLKINSVNNSHGSSDQDKKEKSTQQSKTTTPKQIIPPIGSMVQIPSGNFKMGATEEEARWHQQFCNTYDRCNFVDYSDMIPPHTVFIDSYSIDVHEVTNSQYQECVDAGVCSAPDKSAIQEYLSSDYYTKSSNKFFPVVGINWKSAETYCKWKGKRLPTEAEWEKAAKAGDDMLFSWLKSTTNTSIYNFFPNQNPMLNFCDVNCLMKDRPWVESRMDDGWGGPSPVMSYPPNPYGIFDLDGNVQEWIDDYYSSTFYDDSPTNNPRNIDYSDYRITRGGGWNNGLYHSTSEFRRGTDPTKKKAFIGFRCVKQ